MEKISGRNGIYLLSILLIGILLVAWLVTQFRQEPSEKPLGKVTYYTYTPPQRPEFENETEEVATTVWEKVKDFHEAKSVISEKNSSVIVYMHPYTVGMFNPKTAEWVVIVSSIPETTNEIKVAIFRLDYQTCQIKKAYKFSYPAGEELTLEESVVIMESEMTKDAYGEKKVTSEKVKLLDGNYIYSYPACDFGGTIMVNKYARKTIFYATTVWAGTGRIIIPEE